MLCVRIEVKEEEVLEKYQKEQDVIICQRSFRTLTKPSV